MHGGGAAVITDKMMQEAAEELYQALLTSLPDENQCSYQFSERFERRMKRLIRRAEHPLRHRILQRVASIALVLFLGFVTLLAISPSVRAAVFGWVREQYENFAAYYFDGEIQQNIEPKKYELGYVPDNYQEVHREETEEKTNIYYLDVETGFLLIFTYAHECSAYAYNLNLSNACMEAAIVNGCSADYYASNNTEESNALVWVDLSIDTLFCIKANMSKEELISLAENVE